MKWKQPPLIKVYEALGAVADATWIEATETFATVYSSSRRKSYRVEYSPKDQAIMANDNGSYWVGYLGYPTIAFLLARGILEYRPHLANLLKGVAWKDLNQIYKNDFEKTLEHLQKKMKPLDWDALSRYTSSLLEKISRLNLELLGPKERPPSGY